jgi:hypothetical protein
MTEVSIVSPPKLAKASAPTDVDVDQSKSDISVLQAGNRLEITANVDAAGLVKLKELLDHYEKILNLLK